MDKPATKRVNFMRTAITTGLLLSAYATAGAVAQDVAAPKPNENYLDFNYGQKEDKRLAQWVESIKVLSPAYRSDVKGSVTVEFEAPQMQFARASVWKQPTPDEPGKWGHDAVLAEKIDLAANGGKGSFTFNADEFPNGPMNVRIYAVSADFTPEGSGHRDLCELQLYNTGGVHWNQGVPKSDPAAAAGLKLTYVDDFDGPLNITKNGIGARYSAHKPQGGDFSGWQFCDPQGDGKPFSQRDTYLQIHARKPEGTKGYSGLISTVANDLSGRWFTPPFYMECRFTAQSATGTWPAFWTLTNFTKGLPGDELDIVEAYGGRGVKNPNHPGYSITSHFWGQTNPDGTKKKSVSTRVPIMEMGGKSYWSHTFHTYGLYVDEANTIYYFDDFEVFRHPTNEYSKKPHAILVNYAIGGISGWKIDLERYGNGSDMYVDYIRVYEGQKK
jgi:hypothetical protein